MTNGPVLIGLDGGATKLAAHEVIAVERDSSRGPALALGASSAEEILPRAFEPIAIEDQLAERDAPRIGAPERDAGRAWVAAAARAIATAARRSEHGESGRTTLRVGVCMPGLKTAGERGICVLRHGPRMPLFAEELERELASLGFELVARIARLIGDGEACGLGELHADGGHFRGVAQAYYVGGGTGVAEAILLDGSVRTLDAVGARRAWELVRDDGACFEDLVSMKGINARAELVSRPTTDEHVEQRAAGGDELAVQSLLHAADALAELVALRIRAFREAPGGPRTLERVVIGQRTATLLADARLDACFRQPFERALARRIESGSQLSSARFAGGPALASFVRVSRLRGAPAIGAAATALGAD